MDELLLRELTPAVIGVLVRRGVDFATAEDAVQEALVQAASSWPDGQPADPKGWLVTVAWRKFLDARRSEASRRDREERLAPRAPPPRARAPPPRPGGAARGRAATRPDRERGRHRATVLPVRPPVADPGFRSGPHAARRGRVDHPADRPGLPRAGGDDGTGIAPHA